jgi:hypothetical protein
VKGGDDLVRPSVVCGCQPFVCLSPPFSAIDILARPPMHRPPPPPHITCIFSSTHKIFMTMTMKPTEMESAEPTTANNNNKKTAPTLSKRQRHAAGPNPSNTWQQQPRIKSAGARARAYIAYAGLADDEDDDAAGGDSKAPAASSGGGRKEKSSSSSSTNKAALLLDPQIDLNSPEVKFGRMLGGTDQRKRHTAVKLLRSYLTSRADFTKGGVGFSQLDFLKLWKVSEED